MSAAAADANGWTTIKPRSGRHGRTRKRAGPTTGSGAGAVNTSDITPLPELTVTKLLAELETCRTRWVDTVCAKDLEAIVSQVARRKRSLASSPDRIRSRSRSSTRRKSPGCHVDTAICIATGSFSADYAGLEGRCRALWQLVGFLAIVDLLDGSETLVPTAEQQQTTQQDSSTSSSSFRSSDKNDNSKSNSRKLRRIKVYAQEPRYNAVDEAFLAALGIEVLNADDHAAAVSSIVESLPQSLPSISSSSSSSSVAAVTAPATSITTSTSSSTSNLFNSPSLFLYSAFLEWRILLPRFLASADPVLYVGQELDSILNYISLADPDSWSFVDSSPSHNHNSSSVKGGNDSNISSGSGRNDHLTKAKAEEIATTFQRGRTGVLWPEFDLYALVFEGLWVYWRAHDDEEKKHGENGNNEII